jgi:hypothetical protein
LPPRLEVRASFDDDSFVVTVVFGGYHTGTEHFMTPTIEGADDVNSWRGDGDKYRIQVTHTREHDQLVDPTVSGEEVFGKPQPRRSRIKACAAAAVLVAWREASAAGLTPALPSFVSFVAITVSKALAGDTVQVGRNVWPTCIDPGVAVCQMGIIAGEMVRGGPRGNTLMLRRKMGELYEGFAHDPLPGSSGQDRIRCYNHAVKAYKDMLVRLF